MSSPVPGHYRQVSASALRAITIAPGTSDRRARVNRLFGPGGRRLEIAATEHCAADAVREQDSGNPGVPIGGKLGCVVIGRDGVGVRPCRKRFLCVQGERVSFDWGAL